MRDRLRSVLLAIAAPALGATAQAPVAPPVNPPPQQPQPAPDQPAPQPPAPPQQQPATGAEQSPPAPPPTPPADPATQPVDATRAAAELLRRRLGLEPGPQGTPPPGPTQQEQKPAAPVPAPGPQDPTPAPTEPPASQEPEPVDPTEAARRAMERLLPGARPPEAAPMPGAPSEPARQQTAAPEPAGLWWGGVLATQYRMRHGAGATDQDLVARLTMDVGRAERDAVTAHVSARGYADLDGSRTDDPFAGLDESLGESINGRLYGAYVDAHRIPHVELARLGRQDVDETPVVLTFDGARADSERFGAMRAWLSAYGGVPVHYFEASAHGDSVFGAAGGFAPWKDARIRLDWMDLRDEYLSADRHDSLTGVHVWQNVGDVQLTGLYTWLDGNPRDLLLGARGDLDVPLHFRCDYRELLSTQRALVTELDPFYEIAAEYYPYRQVAVTVGTDVGDWGVVDVGADVRRLDDEGDEAQFNREFERWYADLTLLDLLARGLSLTVSGSIWDSTGEEFETIAGDIEYRPDRLLRVTLGTAYDLFRYDALDDFEREHVRSWYLRIDRRVTEALRIDGGYEYERSDSDEFHVIRLEVTWTF